MALDVSLPPILSVCLVPESSPVDGLVQIHGPGLNQVNWNTDYHFIKE